VTDTLSARVPSPHPVRRFVDRGRWWVGLFLAAFLLRAGWGIVRLTTADDPSALEFPDEEQFWAMAGSLWNGNGLRDELGFRATRMPLYPSFLSPFTALPNGVVAAKVVHWLTGAAAAVVTAALAVTFFDRRVGAFAGLLVAFDPFLVFFSSLLLTETFFVVALGAFWWAVAPLFLREERSVTRLRWLGIGVAAALCVYLRESSFALILGALAFVVVIRRFERGSLLGSAIALGIVIATLVPWAARNRMVTGEWCWLTHRAGISLYDGVGPQAAGGSDLGSIKQSEAVRGLDEVAWNRYFLNEALRAIRAEPARILRLAVIKVTRMWNPLPNVETYRSPSVRAVSAIWTVSTFILAVAGVMLLSIRSRRNGLRTALFLLLPALYFTALHALFVGSVRYRIPSIPMIEILAAVAVSAVFEGSRGRRARHDGEPTSSHTAAVEWVPQRG